MEFLTGLWCGILVLVLAVAFSNPKMEVTYPMMVKAEKTCYSNQGIKSVASFRDKTLTVKCNNGAQFEFEEGDYRNE